MFLYRRQTNIVNDLTAAHPASSKVQSPESTFAEHVVIVGRRRKARQARRRIVGGRHHLGFILKIDILSRVRDTLFVPSEQRGPFLSPTTDSAPYAHTFH